MGNTGANRSFPPLASLGLPKAPHDKELRPGNFLCKGSLRAATKTHQSQKIKFKHTHTYTHTSGLKTMVLKFG